MSYATPQARKGAPTAFVLPRIGDPVTAAQVNLMSSLIEQHEAQRPARNAQQIPAFAAIRLVDTAGATWQLTVDTAGALHINQVPR
jgi:hypothetical protein